MEFDAVHQQFVPASSDEPDRLELGGRESNLGVHKAAAEITYKA